MLSAAAADPAKRDVLKALAAQHCHVTTAVPERARLSAHLEPVTHTAAEDGGVRIAPVPVRGGGSEGDGGRWDMKTIRRLLTDVRPDWVHVEAEPTSRLAALTTSLSEGLGIPCSAVTWRSLPDKLSRRERSYRARTLGHVRGLMAGTGLAAALIRDERPGLPVRVIPEPARGIPAAPPHRPAERFTIGFVGRLVPERGLDLLFHASVQVPAGWTLTVLGTGPTQEALERLAERLGIASRITWRGGLPLSARRAIWPDIDCLVVPSRPSGDWVETRTPALLEAMSHGVAVVGSDAGAVPEVIGPAGIIFPVNDTAALASALERLADSSCRHALAGAARERVIERFAPPALARETARFWTHLLERR